MGQAHPLLRQDNVEFQSSFGASQAPRADLDNALQINEGVAKTQPFETWLKRADCYRQFVLSGMQEKGADLSVASFGGEVKCMEEIVQDIMRDLWEIIQFARADIKKDFKIIQLPQVVACLIDDTLSQN